LSSAGRGAQGRSAWFTTESSRGRALRPRRQVLERRPALQSELHQAGLNDLHQRVLRLRGEGSLGPWSVGRLRGPGAKRRLAGEDADRSEVAKRLLCLRLAREAVRAELATRRFREQHVLALRQRVLQQAVGQDRKSGV